MVVRGRLAFDDQGRLVEISEDAADPTNPQPSEIDPVEFEELIAQTAAAQNLDAGQLVSGLDAAGYDISNVDALDANSVSAEDARIGQGEGTTPKRFAADDDPTRPNATVPRAEVSGLPDSGLMEGERIRGPSWRPVMSDTAIDNDGYNDITQFRIGPIDSPAGMVPILRFDILAQHNNTSANGSVYCIFKERPSVGTRKSIEFNIPSGDTDLQGFYGEIDLSRVTNGTVDNHNLRGPLVFIQAQENSGTGNGNEVILRQESTVGIDYEVV